MLSRSAKILLVGQGDVIERSLRLVLERNGFRCVLSAHDLQLPLLDRPVLARFFDQERPQYVFVSSLRSGGIGANRAFPAEFFYENIVAQSFVIDLARLYGVKKLLYLAASCIYPKECAQPIKEEYFLSAPMEATSLPYSSAKSAGVVMCQAYRQQYGFPAIVAVPATVFGPGPEHDLEDAHVMGALIGKFRRARREGVRKIELWGTGNPRREFLYGDDLAEACLFLMEQYDSDQLINIGSGRDIAISELAALVACAVGYEGEVAWDSSRPDGAQRKLLDNSRILSLGWDPRTSLEDGIRLCCQPAA